MAMFEQWKKYERFTQVMTKCGQNNIHINLMYKMHTRAGGQTNGRKSACWATQGVRQPEVSSQCIPLVVIGRARHLIHCHVHRHAMGRVAMAGTKLAIAHLPK